MKEKILTETPSLVVIYKNCPKTLNQELDHYEVLTKWEKIVCVNDTSSLEQEGTSQKKQSLICKIGETLYLSTSQKSWYGDGYAP